MKLLLNDNRERVDINGQTSFWTGQTSFWIACFEGQIEVVELLLNDKS